MPDKVRPLWPSAHVGDARMPMATSGGGTGVNRRHGSRLRPDHRQNVLGGPVATP